MVFQLASSNHYHAYMFLTCRLYLGRNTQVFLFVSEDDDADDVEVVL